MVDGSTNSSFLFHSCSFLLSIRQFSHTRANQNSTKNPGESVQFSGSLFLSLSLLTPLYEALSSLILHPPNSNCLGFPEFSGLYLSLRETDELWVSLPFLVSGAWSLSLQSSPSLLLFSSSIGCTTFVLISPRIVVLCYLWSSVWKPLIYMFCLVS